MRQLVKRGFMNSLVQLRTQWQECGVSIRPGATDSELAVFENNYHTKMPTEFVVYLELVDGMNLGDCDTHSIRFWPLAEISPLSAVLPEQDSTTTNDIFVFADYSIWTHGYAIKTGEPGAGSVVLVGGESPLPVSPTFEEFVAAYLGHPEQLFPKRSLPLAYIPR